uniref:Uncharacterized protein n=1 Tax=viral metagenome TaxID=1070528 RepID=A0A6M3XZP7_9ZZZZ
MTLNNQTKRSIQALLSDIRWEAVETVVDEYVKENFVQESVKRDTEFNTIWYSAHSEGGKHHLLKFFKELENEAQSLNE